MTATELLAALPLLVLATASIVVMLAVAIRRHHGMTALLTLAGLAATLASLPLAAAYVPHRVTPLLALDGYALFYTGLFSAAAFATVLLSYRYLVSRPGVREEYYLLLLLATLGAAVLAASRHLAALFLGLELLSVSLYALIAYPVARLRSLEAGVKYLVLAGVSSAFLLFGMALVYADLGTLEFARMAPLAAGPGRQPYVLAGLALIVAGAGFKLSLVPFHLWTPDVFEGAPAPVGGFLASVSKGAMLALLLRYFAEAGLYRSSSLAMTITVLAIASMLVGNLLALLQDNVKRLLAYSSIAHIGYLLVALRVGGAFGVEAVTYYLVAYIVMNLGAFGVVTVLSQEGSDGDGDTVEHYRGLFWRRPWLAAAFTVMLFSLAGIPLTAGFIAKFYVLAAGISAGLWLLVAGIVVGSAIGLYYYLRVVVVMYLAPTVPAPARAPPSPLDNAALAALTLLALALGLLPGPLMQWIQTTAVGLV